FPDLSELGGKNHRTEIFFYAESLNYSDIEYPRLNCDNRSISYFALDRDLLLAKTVEALAPLGRVSYRQNLNDEFQPMQSPRATLIDETVTYHEAGLYSAATLLTMAQIDGLTRDAS